MSFEVALSNAAASVPECVAAGYVDVASGMLLSLKTVDSHPSRSLICWPPPRPNVQWPQREHD